MAYAPDQMFEHGLDIKKGWFDMASLDYAAKLDGSVDGVVRGSVVHVNSSGNFAPGVSDTGIAIFLLNGSSDADVSNPGTTAGGVFMHQAVAPTGKLSGVVATGGYEISTTEYDKDQTYVPGQLLSSPTSGALAGKLTNQNAVQYTNAVCGVVSSGESKNHNGIEALSFWSVWLPAAS